MTELYIASTAPLENDVFFAERLTAVCAERRARVEKIRRADERRRSLGAELLLQRVLVRYGIMEYTIARGVHGKPYLVGHEGLFFNLSHAGEYALCAVCDKEIGCDIERIDPEINLSVADRFFTPEESAWIRDAHTQVESIDRFFRLWTLKESLIKATGKGFAISPRAFSFAMEGASPRIISPAAEYAPYTFSEPIVPRGYRAAVCSAALIDESLHPVEINIETPC